MNGVLISIFFVLPLHHASKSLFVPLSPSEQHLKDDTMSLFLLQRCRSYQCHIGRAAAFSSASAFTSTLAFNPAYFGTESTMPAHLPSSIQRPRQSLPAPRTTAQLANKDHAPIHKASPCPQAPAQTLRISPPRRSRAAPPRRADIATATHRRRRSI